jgi:hypothetical protein
VALTGNKANKPSCFGKRVSLKIETLSKLKIKHKIKSHKRGFNKESLIVTRAVIMHLR